MSGMMAAMVEVRRERRLRRVIGHVADVGDRGLDALRGFQGSRRKTGHR